MWFPSSSLSFVFTILLAIKRQESSIKTIGQKVVRLVQEQPNAMIWVDVENVRGHSGFTLSHQDILDQTTLWIKQIHGGGLYGKIVLVVDHGSVNSGYWLQDRGLAIVFAGPGQKADDVLAKEAGRSLSRTTRRTTYQQAKTTTIVVTADSELQRRCKRGASSKNNMYIMHPDKFLDNLERQYEAYQRSKRREEKQKTEQEQLKDEFSSEEAEDINVDKDKSVCIDSATADTTTDWEEDIRLGKLDAEIRLGGQLLDAEALLASKNKKTMTTKRRKKLEKRINTLREKLAQRGPSVLERVTSTLSTASSSNNNPFSTIDTTRINGVGMIMEKDEQDALLSRWAQLRTMKPRRETTGDRVLLAERLRRQIVDSGEGIKFASNNPSDGNEKEDAIDSSQHYYSPAKDHVNHINGYLSPAISQSKRRNRNQRGKRSTKVDLRHADFSTTGQGTTIIDSLADACSDDDTPMDSLKVVVVSDTHGFEDHFALGKVSDDDDDNDSKRDSSILPDGDILLHLGDFALDNGSYESCLAGLERFDSWLAKQPHKYKIVLRGNHDPWSVDFSQSGAAYITKPRTVTIGGEFVLALIPYASSRMLAASGGLPSKCDILASHVPPKNNLDRCYNGRRAGSGFLTGVVHGMVGGGQPRVWFCGHIHESRGVKEKRFGKTGRSTTIINASNANCGRASHLVHGPVVVQLDACDDHINILQMEDKSIQHIQRSSKFFDKSMNQGEENVNEMLLAVDLGLQSGLSLFNDRGDLVRYEQIYFEDIEDLRNSAKDLIHQWQEDVNSNKHLAESDDVEGIINKNPWMITHVAIEGNDLAMRDVWAEATASTRHDGEEQPDHHQQQRSLLLVRPDEWRASLLSKKERQSGTLAKAAARLIARQIVADYGVMELHNGKFKTDVAESVVMGLYVTRMLGWATREPAIQRYSNGRVVVPKAFG